MFSQQRSLGSTLLLVTLVILNLFALTTMYGCAEQLSDDQDNDDDSNNETLRTPEPTSLVLIVIAIACGGLWCLIRRREH